MALLLSPLSRIVFFCLILGFPNIGFSACLSFASVTEDHLRALVQRLSMGSMGQPALMSTQNLSPLSLHNQACHSPP